jgi:hypothetical protein
MAHWISRKARLAATAAAISVLPALAIGMSAVAASNGSNNDVARAEKASPKKTVRAFDRDRSQSIDADELAALNESYADAPTGAIAALDTDKDGKVSAVEVTSVKLGGAKPAGLKQFDKNGNRKIDGEEVVALRKQYEIAPDGSLKALDLDGDSTLGDDEIAKASQRLEKQSGGKKRPPATDVAPATAIQEKPAAGTGRVRLSWRAPTRNTDGTTASNLSGYLIRYGRSPTLLDRSIVVDGPGSTSGEVTGLGDGTWYFTVSAMTRDGGESRPSSVVSKTVASGANPERRSGPTQP